MASTALVDSQIEDGRKIVAQLDRDGFAIDSALWYFDSDRERWVLMIATPFVDSIGPRKSYEKVRESLDKLPEPFKTYEIQVSLVRPENDLVRLLKTALKTGPGISEIRFTGNVIDGTLIEDALIYRLGSAKESVT